MARCRPVFPVLDSSPAPAATLPSSFSTSTSRPRKETNIIERAAKSHAKLRALPDELSPPSRSPSPASGTRTALLRDEVSRAVDEAGSPANPRWAQVHRTLRMACTSRMYRGVPSGVRIGEQAKVELGSYKFRLPASAEEWEQCEEEWKRRFLHVPTVEGQSSKYWPSKPNPVAARQSEEKVVKTLSKAELVRDKVKAWQATIPLVSEKAEANMFQTSNNVSDKVKELQDVVQGEVIPRLKQSPIPFPVAKTSVVATGSRTEKPRTSPVLPIPAAVSLPSPQQHVEAHLPGPLPSEPGPVRIRDVSEMSFLPPSFPPQLDTSTPPHVEKEKVIHKLRTKPAPILPLRSSVSSPSALPLMSKLAIERIASTSSGPPTSPIRLAKHSRPLTPPPDNSSAITSEGPPSKKPRVDSLVAQSSAPLPPSTPPPSSLPPRTPSPVLRKGLGNAKGTPLPTTPNRNPLPTLTELLASTRKSKPRPRPPSRKTPATMNVGKVGISSPRADELPTVGEAHEPSPAPTAASRAKTVFSSPASGSSDSPQSLRDRPRSPISPLFGSSFVPPFASTQQNGTAGAGFGGMASSQHFGPGLARRSSGVFGMGYNSQFDVEGQIGMVNDLLERDVDFDGWLRDIPEVDVDAEV